MHEPKRLVGPGPIGVELSLFPVWLPVSFRCLLAVLLAVPPAVPLAWYPEPPPHAGAAKLPTSPPLEPVSPHLHFWNLHLTRARMPVKQATATLFSKSTNHGKRLSRSSSASSSFLTSTSCTPRVRAVATLPGLEASVLWLSRGPLFQLLLTASS